MTLAMAQGKPTVVAMDATRHLLDWRHSHARLAAGRLHKKVYRTTELSDGSVFAKPLDGEATVTLASGQNMPLGVAAAKRSGS